MLKINNIYPTDPEVAFKQQAKTNSNGFRECPFCGTFPEVTTHKSYNKTYAFLESAYVMAKCPNCNCTMGTWSKRGGSYDSTVDSVRTMWNHRVK